MTTSTQPPIVLIIEDDPVFRRVLSFTVSKTGLAVEAVADGQTGLDRLIQGDISFLVTDYQVPRLEGIELLRAIRKMPELCDLPAVLCTAKGFEIDSEQLRKEFDLVAVLHKPFSPRQLSELIVRSLESRGVTIQPSSSNSPTSMTFPSSYFGSTPPPSGSIHG
ncbi:response regulator [Stieleria sp. JC731]|uniref:response regulator n=1 Tax=Pirellulaceae TaxID=2691357 RepID=UPI001E44F256|nr:response regulator [Stieleria sp. JC731]MCC9601500.1 response regulator [Stieleria sp. JC731]